MKTLHQLFIVLFLAGCAKKQNYVVSDYLTSEQQTALMGQVVRFMYYAEGIPAASRFDSAYDAKYTTVLPNFSFERYFIDEDDSNYFLVLRSYSKGMTRALGGKMRLDSDQRIMSYEEVFVTPLASEIEAISKGEFLFDQLARHGVLDPKYQSMKSYVEWPDQFTAYDTITHQWLPRQRVN